MTWNEHEIRESMNRGLESMYVPSHIPTTTLRRARNRRFASLGSVAVTTVLVVLAAVWGTLSLDRNAPDRPVGPPTEPSFVRLLAERQGLIEIEASKGQACYRFDMRDASTAHIHERGSNKVLVELPTNGSVNNAFLGCTQGLNSAALQAVAERPDEYVVEFHHSSFGSFETVGLSPDTGEADCLPTELTSWEYGLHFSEKEGHAGDEVTVWGTTLRDEGGGYAPSNRFELWWNAEVPDESRPKDEGPAIRLASIPGDGRCYFQTSFSVPDAPEGEYQITGFVWDDPPDEGYGVFPGPRFTVTSGSSDLPPCDDDRSYGQSIPGRWLEDVIVTLGAPGGYQVTKQQVGDTGTALEIRVPEYDNDPTIYATMLTPGDDPNIPSPPPEEEIGKQGNYTLYRQNGNPWQGYKAVSEDWQLSIMAYPGADNDEVAWPDDTVEWLTRAAEIAQESPPACSGPIN